MCEETRRERESVCVKPFPVMNSIEIEFQVLFQYFVLIIEIRKLIQQILVHTTHLRALHSLETRTPFQTEPSLSTQAKTYNS